MFIFHPVNRYYVPRLWNVLTLDHEHLTYDPYKIRIRPSEKKLILELPANWRKKLRTINPEFEIHDPQHLDSYDEFRNIGLKIGVDNLSDLIAEHIQIVAERFAEKLTNDYAFHNGIIYGINGLTFSREGPSERSALDIELYECDYFTYKVFRSIYDHLSGYMYQLTKIDQTDILEGKYRYFMTSLGLNAFVIINYEGLREIVFIKRSEKVAHMGGWHVSMNEALSLKDKKNNFSITDWFNRGLNEELRIPVDFERKRGPFFCDVFLERNHMELGITSYVEFEMTPNELRDMYECAQDRSLEGEELKLVGFNKRDLDDFISENRKDVTPQTFFTLKMIRTREMT